MTLTKIAKRLGTPPRVLEREGLQAYLERRLRTTEASLAELAARYGVRSLTAFDRAIRAGRIRETDESREDLFTYDALTAEHRLLRSLLRSV